MRDFGEVLDLYRDDRKAERQSLRSRVLRWMVVLGIIAIGLALSGCASAPTAPAQPMPLHVHESEAAVVKLMPGDCVDQTTQMLIAAAVPPPLQAKEWRHIDSRWRMNDGSWRDFPGCWADDGDAFIVVFSDGQGGRVDKGDFGRSKGQTGV